ncbi:MAG: sporulation protein YqfD [Bacilli bacterium]
MNRIKKFHCYLDKSNLELLSKFKIYNLKVIDDYLSFYCDKFTLDQLSTIIEVEYEEVLVIKIKRFFRKYLISILGICLIILALVNQSKSIVGVRFTNSDTYNEEILNYLDKYYKKIGPFSYLNSDLTIINTDLRKTFYQYEWIGIRKNGAYLYIDIKEIKNISYENDPREGSYYAKIDGIIKRYHVEKGIILIQEEQYIAKGEKLISGEIPYQNGEIKNIRAKGYVIAEVLQYKEFYIPKENLSIIKTGKIVRGTELYVFGIRFGKSKNKFQEFEKEEKITFNLFNIIQKKEADYYETKHVKDIYSEADAIEYAKSMVLKEFKLNKVNPFEKIIFNELVKIELDGNNYYVKLIVKTYENIAEFIPDEIRQ